TELVGDRRDCQCLVYGDARSQCCVPRFGGAGDGVGRGAFALRQRDCGAGVDASLPADACRDRASGAATVSYARLFTERGEVEAGYTLGVKTLPFIGIHRT